jgi:hypothetical protein
MPLVPCRREPQQRARGKQHSASHSAVVPIVTQPVRGRRGYVILGAMRLPPATHDERQQRQCSHPRAVGEDLNGVMNVVVGIGLRRAEFVTLLRAGIAARRGAKWWRSSDYRDRGIFAT